MIAALLSEFLPYVALGGTLLGLVTLFLGNGVLNRREGRKQAAHEAEVDSLKRQKAGQDAVDDIDDADRDGRISVLHDNDAKW